MSPESLNAARVLMSDSLGFHIIFVMFGLTLPILVSWFEYMGIRNKDKQLLKIAQFWSKIMAMLVIAGVISGTIIALQMSLVWPGILRFGGEVIGLPFLFETYAFLIEAVFLALYMSTWNNPKIKPWVHWVFGLFIVLGSTLSAFAITSINAWMNHPTGFEIINGKLVQINVWHALFSRTAIVEFVHSMPAYYFAAMLTVAGLYAVKIMQSKRKNRLDKKHHYDWFVIQRIMIVCTLLFLVLGVTADITGKYLAKYEPTKLAAIELHFKTSAQAPMVLGGVAASDDTVKGAHIEIPGLLSFLASNSTSAIVVGLDQVKPSQRPPLYVHTLFTIKMTIVGILALLFLLYFALKRWRPTIKKNTWFLGALPVMGLLAVVLVELGWMLTEIGRQPWAVRNFVTTAQAITKTHDITAFGYFFPISYIVLFIATAVAIRVIAKKEAK